MSKNKAVAVSQDFLYQNDQEEFEFNEKNVIKLNEQFEGGETDSNTQYMSNFGRMPSKYQYGNLRAQSSIKDRFTQTLGLLTPVVKRIGNNLIMELTEDQKV